jgi:hypothetical protein
VKLLPPPVPPPSLFPWAATFIALPSLHASHAHATHHYSYYLGGQVHTVVSSSNTSPPEQVSSAKFQRRLRRASNVNSDPSQQLDQDTSKMTISSSRTFSFPYRLQSLLRQLAIAYWEDTPLLGLDSISKPDTIAIRLWDIPLKRYKIELIVSNS